MTLSRLRSLGQYVCRITSVLTSYHECLGQMWGNHWHHNGTGLTAVTTEEQRHSKGFEVCTCTILWMLCMIIEVSIAMPDTPIERLPCLWRSSICERDTRQEEHSSLFCWRWLTNTFPVQTVSTFEASCSTLSATFPTAKRTSVFCWRASVIRKEVRSPEPGENNTITTGTTTAATQSSLRVV